MISLILRHKTIFLFFLLIFCVLVISTIISFTTSSNQPKESLSPSPTPIQSPPGQAVQISSDIVLAPAPVAPLNPGQRQQFVVTFAKKINLNTLSISLSRVDIGSSDPPTPVAIQTTLGSNKQATLITTVDPIAPLAGYTLSITDRSTGTNVVNAQYSSADVTPTPVATNNLELVPYVPYQTPSYTLTYDRAANIYVFSFIFNADQPGTIQEQFEKAKADATSFIQSKGIDINSIVINWNYH